MHLIGVTAPTLLNSNLQWWNVTLVATASKSGAVRSASLRFRGM
jgi:hypothetical protein